MAVIDMNMQSKSEEELIVESTLEGQINDHDRELRLIQYPVPDREASRLPTVRFIAALQTYELSRFSLQKQVYQQLWLWVNSCHMK